MITLAGDDHGVDAARIARRERQTLAEHLHDSLGQELWALGLRLDELRVDCPVELEAPLAEVAERLQHLRLREELHRLHRGSLGERSLADALRELAAELARPGGPAIVLTLPPASIRAEPAVEDQLWCVALEAIGNAHRHGGRGTIQVSWQVEATVAELEVVNVVRHAAPDERGIGLTSMARRVQGLGGQLETGRETDRWTLRATIPRPGPRALAAVPPWADLGA